ncbi:hypothetical protein BH10PSE4_BH10PSE4_40020 [soil metagenome]
MPEDRKPRPRCPIDRRIHDLEAAKLRHWKLTKIARLEREIADLPDPTRPGAHERASGASTARIQALLNDLARLEAASEPDGD